MKRALAVLPEIGLIVPIDIIRQHTFPTFRIYVRLLLCTFQPSLDRSLHLLLYLLEQVASCARPLWFEFKQSRGKSAHVHGILPGWRGLTHDVLAMRLIFVEPEEIIVGIRLWYRWKRKDIEYTRAFSPACKVYIRAMLTESSVLRRLCTYCASPG